MKLLIVELHANEVIFASFRTRKGELLFLEATRHPLADTGEFTTLLKDHVAGPGEERRVILALPAQHFFSRELELPVTDRRKLREVLPLELKGETAVDTDDLVFDAIPVSTGKIMAIWARKRDLQEQIRIMTEAGLEPEVVTTSLFHWNTLIPAEASARTVAITDGKALAVYESNRPVCFRYLGAVEPQSAIARTLSALEISSEIKTETVYFHGNALEPSDVTYTPLPLTGPLAATFPDDHAAARDLAGVYAIARSCAEGEPVNLRSGSLAYTAGQGKTRRKLRLTMILAGVVLLLLFVETGIRYYLVRTDLASLNNSIRNIYREVFPNRKKPVDEVSELKSEIKRLGGGKTSSNVLLVLKALSEAKGDDISGIFEADVEGKEVRLKGDARSIQAVNDFKGKCAVFCSKAEVSEIKSRPDGSVTFVLIGSFKEEGK